MRWAEPLVVRIAADHLTREPVGYLTAAGFAIECSTAPAAAAWCFECGHVNVSHDQPGTTRRCGMEQGGAVVMT